MRGQGRPWSWQCGLGTQKRGGISRRQAYSIQTHPNVAAHGGPLESIDNNPASQSSTQVERKLVCLSQQKSPLIFTCFLVFCLSPFIVMFLLDTHNYPHTQIILPLSTLLLLLLLHWLWRRPRPRGAWPSTLPTTDALQRSAEL